MAKTAKFLRRPWRDRIWLLEALGTLILARVLATLIPFPRLAQRLGKAQTATPLSITPEQRAVVTKVSWAVTAVARHVPFAFVCLPQAIAAQHMLFRRRIATTMYFGVRAGADPTTDFTLHAWLRAGDKIVCGERESVDHVVVLSLARLP